MPEQQASPSSSGPPSTLKNNEQRPPSQDATPAPESAKRTYLSLLPPPQLIDLILAINENRQMLIFPHDLDSAIKALQRSQRQSQSPPPQTAAAASVVVKAEATPSSVPPPAPPPLQNHASPAPSPVVQPPQYKPPPYKQPPSHTHMYPYTHTPYYPPPQPPQTQVPAPSPPQPPPAAPARHPLFTSAPLTRDPNKPPLARPTPLPVVSSRDDPNAMPSYEEMIVEAIIDVGDGEGTAPKILFAWMASHYPLQQNFRPSASQALHKALRRGRLEKIGGKYRLNPSWGGGPTTSKRATRRPTASRAISPSLSRPQPRPTHPPAMPPPGYTHMQPPYGYPGYPPHPSMPPNPYNAPYVPNAPWAPGQPQPYPPPVSGVESRTDEMETDDGGESEEAETGGTGMLEETVPEEVADDDRMKEKIRQSLVRLARVLKRFAKKGEGTG